MLTHALLIHLDANFVKFHVVFDFLGHSKIGATAHVEIEGFFMYRDGYTQKIPPNLRTYAFVWHTIAYAAMLKVFQVF